MFTILGVWDSITRLPIHAISIETRGVATISNLGGGRHQIDGSPEARIRISAGGYIPTFRSVGGGGVSEGIVLRPVNALPRPSHSLYRLTWRELSLGLPDWDRMLVAGSPAPPLLSGFTSFDLLTLPGIWWKALKIFDSRGRLLQDLQSQEGRVVRGRASTFRISTLNGASLVFSKAKFIGHPADMYEVTLDDQVLRTVQGHVWTFHWVEQ